MREDVEAGRIQVLELELVAQNEEQLKVRLSVISDVMSVMCDTGPVTGSSGELCHLSWLK